MLKGKEGINIRILYKVADTKQNSPIFHNISSSIHNAFFFKERGLKLVSKHKS